MKNTNAIVCCLAVISTAIALFEAQSLVDLHRERDTLKAGLASKEAEQLSAAKHECADQAQRYFRVLGYSENDNRAPTGMALFPSFTDHYSKSYDRCLMELVITTLKDGQQIEDKTIFDVNERKQFGEYGRVSSASQNFVRCHISPPGKAEKHCASNDEWEAFEKEIFAS